MKRSTKTSLIAGLALAVGAVSTISVGAASASSAGATTLKVTTHADTVDADLTDDLCRDAAGKCSLRAAVQTANAGTGSYEIALSPRTYELTISPSATDSATDDAASGDLDVTGDLRIVGGNATINLSSLGDRAFDVAADASLTASSLSVKNAALAEGESGGAFRNAGTLSLSKITATNNVVTGEGASGGAVLNTGDLHVSQSNLSHNSATRAGGAIEANAGNTVIERTTMAGNYAGAMPGNGGALHLTGAGYVEVSRSTVSNNVAAAEGGGLWNSATGTMVVSDTSVRNNVVEGIDADQGGGGLYNDGGTLTVTGSAIKDNQAAAGSGSGGAIFNNSGVLNVTDTVLVGNHAARAGGGIETVNGTVAIDGSSIRSNSTGDAPGNGGGLHASGTDAAVTIDRTTVKQNTAALEGGGLWAGAGNSTMVVTNSSITHNTANGTEAINGGGGIFNKGGTLVVADSRISNNSASQGSGSGGGILNLGTLELSGTKVSNNNSARAGGGIESNDVNGAGNASIAASFVLNNTTGAAPGNGGGVHITGSTITTLIDGSVIRGNSAVNEGGGLWNFAGATMTVTNSTVERNRSPIGADVFQNGDGGNFTIDGVIVPALG